MSSCANCGFHNPEDFRFCGSCGQSLGPRCSNCGSELVAGLRFCGQCGTPVAAGPARAAPKAPPEPGVASPPAVGSPAERRLVSVLFADLVGFTALSEKRDPEEVRDLLTRYFEAARRLIGRYGGTVEKFIGDAVMAVWGTPVAQEDDAERAVRAALDLVEAVSILGADVGTEDLRARAAVLTGEAAVTLGAEGQGMVAGDLVNTASRVQGLAAPGTVLVGEATRRSTDAAIVYEHAGSHELKGKAEPLPLWRAVRVVGGVGGKLKSSGLEAPFVGRDGELRLVKELFHASADEGKAHLLSVVGIAGIGKSRLSWEFYKYVDGITEVVYWHRGRCLAYGEGVTYWALAEMVRMRARIAEGEDPEAALAKLRATVEDHVSDLEERRWVEPRLAHLLGLEELEAKDQQELFPAWRLFLERLAERNPTILVFEDLQWADRAMLDFIEYLLEWSRNHSMFVMTLARPELSDRYPTWGAAKRNFTSLFLEPLSPKAMQALLDGLAPGLPEKLRGDILARAEGVPLFAVETVRMLIDRGLLVQDDSQYRPAGAIETLEVPETLQALIAARLDGLRPEERRLVQDASVLGKTFTVGALYMLTGLPEEDLKPLLSALVRKEILGVQADIRSPERGQYGFLQDLVKRVAYETLSRRERKARHLSVARFLEGTHTSEEEEFVQIAASHYLEAYHLAPNAPDAGEIKEAARQVLVRAGQRAASLAASDEAQFYFEQALELTDDQLDRARLAERAGQMARLGARNEEAAAHFEGAIALFEAHGQSHEAARVSGRLAEILWDQGRLGEAVHRLERAFDVLSGEEPDEDIATLTAQLARFQFFNGQTDLARERIEIALHMAEALQLPEIISQALNTKALVVRVAGHREESYGLLRHALKIALDHDLPAAAGRALNNLSSTLSDDDRIEEGLGYATQGLALARRVGSRPWEWPLLSHSVYYQVRLGDWDGALRTAAEIPPAEEVPGAGFARAWTLPPLLIVAAQRGELEEAERYLEEIAALPQGLADVQNRAGYAACRAVIHRVRGEFESALSAAREAIESRAIMGSRNWAVRTGVREAIESGFGLGDLGRVRALVDDVAAWPGGEVVPSLKAWMAMFRARLDWIEGRVEEAFRGYRAAVSLLREIGDVFDLGECLAELGQFLIREGRAAEGEPMIQEARGIFERLGARPSLERLDHAREAVLPTGTS